MIELKDSGIDYIGKIPAHWKISKIKYVAKIYNGNSISDSEKDNYTFRTNIPYIATKDISLDFGTADYENGLFVSPKDNFKIVPAGSTLLCIEGGNAGKKKTFLIRDVAFVNKLCALVPEHVHKKFLFYVVCSPYFKFQFDKNLSGLIGGVTIGGVTLNNIKNFSVILPPLDEQKAIANFLDAKCEKIDDIISDCKQQIEILKDYKKSLITKTVTKGLNPAAEMKDSGIDWIGKIPAHWKISKVGYHFEILLGKMLQPMQINAKDTLENYLCAVNLGKNKFSLELVKQMWFSEKEKKIYSVKRGDLLVVEGGDIGSADIVNFDVENLYFQNALMRVRPLVNYSVNFLKYWVQFAKNTGHIDLICNKATIAHFTKEKFMKLHFASPPLDEQKAIANFLDAKCKEIDDLITLKQNQLEIMTDYKKSLIYEYVTGKKIFGRC